jgi:hypothetical protein
MRTAPFAVCLGLLAAGCVPGDNPPWLIDHPLAWGLVASVVQPGPYSSDLVVPDGQVRAAALPLDTLELQWLVVAPPDTPPLPPPIWIVCGRYCTTELIRSELAPGCPWPLPLSRTQPCRLGEGERVRLTLGGAFTAGPEFLGSISLIAVGSADPELTPETCLERLSTRPHADLQRCLVQTRTLELGPLWKVFVIAPALAEQHLVDDIPPDAWNEPPDTHPVLLGAEVLRYADGGPVEVFAIDGDTVPVRAGERIVVTPVFAEDAAQSYYRPVPDHLDPSRYTLDPVEEDLEFRVALTALVDDFEYNFGENQLSREWVVPDHSEPVILHLYATDRRQGRAFASLRFVTEDPADAP